MRNTVLFIVLVIVLTACGGGSATSSIAYSALPATGDAERGEQLFTQSIDRAPPCSGCHVPGSPASPDLAGFGSIAGSRVPEESAHEYAFYSITEPGRFVVQGYGNAMYNQYDEKMTPQQIADLIAYLLSL